MLDRKKVSERLQEISDKLFPDVSITKELAVATWQRIAHDPAFRQQAEEAQSSFLVPGWHSMLNDTFPINQHAEYAVLAVDGSQIYPDRHVSGAGCFLLNVGGISLSYNAQSSVTLFSEPTVYIPDDIEQLQAGFSFSPDLVDLLREQLELSVGFERAQQLGAHGLQPVTLFDGTIIFWTLEGKTPEVRKYFLQKYLEIFTQFYEKRLPFASYISYPKSRELINLTRLGLCRFSVANCIPCHSLYDTFPCKQVDTLIDTHIVSSFVQPGYRTTLFSSNSNIVQEYPEHLKPWFCYLNSGHEIGRVELPAWVAHDEQLREQVLQVILDQVQKGNGYPVCLAEAHEQAVVKGADREFFYSLIYKVGIEQRRRISMSQKNMKKKRMGV